MVVLKSYTKKQFMISNTTQESVSEELGKEPAELKNPWYYWIKWTLTLPFRVISWPIRYLFMSAICPISRENEEFNQNEIGSFKVKKIDYEISDRTKCRMIFASNNTQTQEVKDRKLAINFGGNCELILDRVNQLNTLKSTNDIIFVEYPKGATYSQELVDGGVSAVLRAIKAGYKPENITIAGHSLGGAVSALVLKEMKNHLKEGEKFAEYINHRSFKDLGAFVAAHAETDQYGWLRKSINFIAWAFRVQLDAEEAIKSGLPVNKITAHYDERDDLIKPAASIGKAIADGGLQSRVETKVVRTNQLGHNEKPSNTLYGGEESESYKNFIEEQKEIAPQQIPAQI